MAAALLAVGGCATGPTPAPSDGLVGLASWYGPQHHGRRTASGAPFDMHALTAAHRTLPLGTRVRVTSVDSGRSVTVTITDRGPFAPDRVIDLSYAAARALGLIERGVGPVRLELVPGP